MFVAAACGGITSPGVPTPLAPAPRAGHVLATAGEAGGVFLHGGQIDAQARTADTLWQWRAGSWRVLASGGPSERSLAAAAWDARRNVLVVHGGGSLTGTYVRYGETWEWDGGAWRQHAGASPGPRDHHALAYDGARGVMVMYGGQVDPDAPFPTGTWTWDGATWTQASNSIGPGGLVHHAMAYDAERGRVVLYGGRARTGGPPVATWEWDGATWQRFDVPGPGPRAGHRMAYDPVRRVVVLFGDEDNGETWTWNGAAWSRAAVTGPPPRVVHAMAWDAGRQRVMLFGGSGSGGHAVLGDLWAWDGTGWTQEAAAP
jgi:hypothetical protein